MADPYLGQIMIFAGTFAIKNWALCNGQLMSVNQNTALFSLLGTTYGGDGVQTFALPNLQGRVPMHFGARPGGPTYVLGEFAGNEAQSILISNLPAHNHIFNPVGATATVQAGNAGGTVTDPSGNYMVNTSDGAGGSVASFAAQGDAGTLANLAGVGLNFNAGAIGLTGSNIPLNTMPPYLALNYQICLSGIYPSRN